METTIGHFTKSPEEALRLKAEKLGVCYSSKEFCNFLDEQDTLAHIRSQFTIPKLKNFPYVVDVLNPEEECIYFCGHSLGPKPKCVDERVQMSLNAWGNWAAFGHAYGEFPFMKCDIPGRKLTANLVGAKENEVALMNSLTVNLHLLMIHFYRPTEQRHKILIEDNAFPSDRYAVRSQIQMHGFSEDSLLKLTPRVGEYTLRQEDIISMIKEEGHSIAVILLPGVHFMTGQKLDIKSIVDAGHQQGCIVGIDLAHSIGNVIVQLHDWDVDFACWCTYKYLNSGPSGIAGIYMHEKHNDRKAPKLMGWWASEEQIRFTMPEEIVSQKGAPSFVISNPPVFAASVNFGALQIYEEVGMEKFLEKQFLLTGYLELLLNLLIKQIQENGRSQLYNGVERNDSGKEICKSTFEIVTPSDPNERGCMLCLIFTESLEETYKLLQSKGVLCDCRKPNVLRISANPLYNTYEDVYKFVEIMREALLV